MISWIVPLVALALDIAGYAAASSIPHLELRNMMMLVVAAISCLLLLVGLITGLVALFSMGTAGGKGILAPALVGTGLSVLLIAAGISAMIPLIKHARERAETNRKNLANVQDSERQLNEAARKALRGGSVSNTETRAKFGQLQKSFEDAAQNMTGNDALAMKASAAYTQRLNSIMTNYDTALAGMKAAQVLKPALVKQKEDLASQRQSVENFLDANHKLRDFFDHGAENYRAEFERLQVPQFYTDTAIRGYQAKAGLINPLLVSIREKDDIVGKDLLEIIALEETNWGHWTVSSANGRIRFEEDSQVKSYNAFLKEMRQASAEEARIQKRILDVSAPTGQP